MKARLAAQAHNVLQHAGAHILDRSEAMKVKGACVRVGSGNAIRTDVNLTCGKERGVDGLPDAAVSCPRTSAGITIGSSSSRTRASSGRQGEID